MLLIFDFDGVLREVTWQGVFDAYVQSIAHIGKNPKDYFLDLEDFKRWYDIDWHKNEEKIFGAPYRPQPEFDRLFHHYFDASAKLFPWVGRIIPQLSEKHVLAILSSSTSESVKNSLGDLRYYFAMIVGCDKVSKLKPNPEGIFHILRALCISHDEAVIIGDNTVDLIAGKRAGIQTAAVKWGIGEWEELLKEWHTYELTSPKQLLNIPR